MATLETTADGKRCALHDQQFKGDDCPRCLAVRAAGAIGVSSVANSVDLDAEIIKDIEADLSFAKFLHRFSRDLIDGGTAIDRNVAAKLIAEGTKLKYRALDQKDKLSARAHSRYLVDHEKEIRGIAKKKGD